MSHKKYLIISYFLNMQSYCWSSGLNYRRLVSIQKWNVKKLYIKKKFVFAWTYFLIASLKKIKNDVVLMNDSLFSRDKDIIKIVSFKKMYVSSEKVQWKIMFKIFVLNIIVSPLTETIGNDIKNFKSKIRYFSRNLFFRVHNILTERKNFFCGI